MKIIGILVLFLVGLFALGLFRDYRKVPNLQDYTSGFESGIGGGPTDVITDLSSQSPVVLRRIQLQKLLNEHGIVASNLLMTQYDGKDTSNIESRVNQNTEKVSELLSQVGNTEVQDQFDLMWQAHIQGYKEYTTALKNNDRNATAISRESLSQHAAEMGVIINQYLPSIPKEEATALMEEHIDLTLSIIEAHATGDMNAKLTQTTKASAQATRFANRIADGIEALEKRDPDN